MLYELRFRSSQGNSIVSPAEVTSYYAHRKSDRRNMFKGVVIWIQLEQSLLCQSKAQSIFIFRYNHSTVNRELKSCHVGPKGNASP